MGRTRASKTFVIFAIAMAGFLLLGSLVVFGGSIVGTQSPNQDDPAARAREQINDLETRVAENPDDGDSAAVLANIYANDGDLSRAISLYERATVSRPEDGNLRLAFGIALLRNRSFLDARVQLERALVLLPNHSGPPYYLGQVEQLKDDPDLDAARTWYEQAVATDPGSVLSSRAQEQLVALDAEPTSTP